MRVRGGSSAAALPRNRTGLECADRYRICVGVSGQGAVRDLESSQGVGV